MLRLRDIMTRDVVTLSPELTVREAMETLARKHVSGAPVIASGKVVVGVISTTDLMQFAASTPLVGDEVAIRFEDSANPVANPLDNYTVADAMTTDVIGLDSSTEVAMAADFMRKSEIHRVLVIDDNQLVGIVTTTDMSKAVADHRLATRTYVFGAEKVFDERGWD